MDEHDPLTRMSLIGRLLEVDASDSLAAARAEFFAIYHPVVRRWCLRRGLQQADADDISQEVTVNLFDKVRSYRRERGPFRRWLRGVVRNAVTDSQRARQRRPLLLGDSWLEALQDEVDQAWQADLQMAEEVVKRVQKRVAPHTWEAFYRFRILGRQTAPEVATSLGISANSVNVAANRVEKMLREERANLLSSGC